MESRSTRCEICGKQCESLISVTDRVIAPRQVGVCWKCSFVWDRLTQELVWVAEGFPVLDFSDLNRLLEAIIDSSFCRTKRPTQPPLLGG